MYIIEKKGGENMAPGIVDLWKDAGTAYEQSCRDCEDNCDGEDDDGVPCQDIEDPPCDTMCND